jgi:pilus assembly protein CpaE
MQSPLRIWLTGDWSRLAGLHGTLAARTDVVVVPEPAADGVVLHATEGAAQLRDELAAVREHGHGPVVVVAAAASPELVEEAIAADVAETLIAPVTADAVAFAVHKAAAAAAAQPRPAGNARVITVFSPKGGTGKTVVATNLAVALAAAGKRTLLVDLDLQFGDVAIMLGLQPERTLHDLLTAPGPLDSEKIAGYATRRGTLLDILPAPIKPEDAETIAEARVAELLDAARTGYDVVIVDTTPFFQPSVLTALDRTDELLLLCAPDVPTMKNVRLTLQTLDLLGFAADRVRLVLNRANTRIGFRAAQVASVVDRPVEVELPDDESVMVAVNRGVPVVELRAQGAFASALAAAAARLDRRVAPQTKARRFAFGRRS